MAFVLPKTAKKGSGKGARKFEAGKRLYGNMLTHNSQDFLAKYPGKPTSDVSSESSILWEGLAKTQVLVNPESFAGQLEYTKTELLNRPAIGLSELGGVLVHMNALVTEGVAKKILHPDFAAKWSVQWEALGLQSAAEVLNTNDYPELPRSSAALEKAVKSVCSFGTMCVSSGPILLGSSGRGPGSQSTPPGCSGSAR